MSLYCADGNQYAYSGFRYAKTAGREITVAFWFKDTGAITVAWARAIEVCDAGRISGFTSDHEINGLKIRSGIMWNGGYDVPAPAVYTDTPRDTWHHVVLRYRPTSNNHQLWLNGVWRQDRNSPTPMGVTAGGARVALNVLASLAAGYRIAQHYADVAVWENGNPTDAEIAALASGAKRPNTVKTDTLVSYWPCTNDANVAKDIIGGNDLTLVGAAANADMPPGLAPLYLPTITFGGVQATNVEKIDGVTYDCDTPAHAAGAVDVTITFP